MLGGQPHNVRSLPGVCTTSGRILPISTAASRRCSGPRTRFQPCRVTNTQDEIFKATGTDPASETAIVYPDYQNDHPELGRLESRVGRLYLDALLEDEVDLEETKYWFTTPEEGWNQEPTKVEKAEEVEVRFPQPWHEDAEDENRVFLEEVEDTHNSQLIHGFISDTWLYHGIQVDIGCEVDGLIPLDEADWKRVNKVLVPGTWIKVRVHQIRTAGLYRWPLQLKIASKKIQKLIMDPDEYDPPIDHGWAEEQGWGIQEILDATGREFTPSTYLWGEKDADWMDDIQREYAEDEPDMEILEEKNHAMQYDRTPELDRIAMKELAHSM